MSTKVLIMHYQRSTTKTSNFSLLGYIENCTDSELNDALKYAGKTKNGEFFRCGLISRTDHEMHTWFRQA